MASSPWQSRFGLPLPVAETLAAELAALHPPPEVAEPVQRLLERLLERLEDEGAGAWAPATPAAAVALVRLGYAAPFLLRFLIANPGRLSRGLLEGVGAGAAGHGAAGHGAAGQGAAGDGASRTEGGLLPFSSEGAGAAGAPPGATEPEMMRGLRLWKYDNYVRLTAQALLGSHPPRQTCALLSDLADGMISRAFRYAFSQQAAVQGLPRAPDGGPGLGAVLGMGKLGGRELNYASDVDLIFFHDASDAPCQPLPEGAELPSLAQPDETVYWEAWQTLAREAPPVREAGPVRPASGGEFHNKVAQKVVRLLSQQTPEGFGFRVDTELRPMGRSGLLAPSLAFLAQYYEAQGREWERTAMIKARQVAGHPGTGREFWQVIRPFVYRRYLDFSALEGVAIVKHDINRNHRTRGADDLKLGAGGIRENEFFIQALQLLYGGKNPELQVPGHEEAVHRLVAAGLLEQQEGQAHLAAYWLMRGQENRLQMVAETQTHALPTEPAARLQVFHDFRPGFAERLPAALAALAEARAGTAERFGKLFAGLGPQPTNQHLLQTGAWQEAVRTHLPPQAQEEALGRIDRLLGRLMQTREGERCVLKVERLLAQPELYRVGTQPALPTWLGFLEQIGNRNALHTLLASHLEILPQVTTLFADGGNHAQLLVRHPEFLDSYLALSKTAPQGFRATFAKIVAAARDEEDFILELRMGKSQALLQILTAYLNAPAESGHRELLSELADATVAACTAFAWRALTERHGLPAGASPGLHPSGFAVMALGKLGSLEMHFASDLDLAFVYGAEGTTAGGKTHFEFFTKLAQKISTLLTSQTQFGSLYEIDHRLRPFGAKGALVPNLNAFSGFVREAEVWNFQAFTRLRFLCGDPALGQAMVAAVATGWRGRGRDTAQVAREVWDMLGRLVRENDPARQGAAGAIPLKYAVGGMIGFEFLCQLNFLRANLAGSEGWTAPGENETIVALRPSYVALGSLDERLAFYEERFPHRVTPELFARLPGLQKAWGMEAVRGVSAELEAGVAAGFEEQMA